MDETAGNAEPVDKATSETVLSGGQTDARPQDIIDRMFSPPDNALADINCELNKGDAGNPPGPEEWHTVRRDAGVYQLNE